MVWLYVYIFVNKNRHFLNLALFCPRPTELHAETDDGQVTIELAVSLRLNRHA